MLFDHISLGINEGDKIGVIGINGTGKSTFLKVLAGVVPADSGRISRAAYEKICRGNALRLLNRA